MLSKSSKWELGFVRWFAISRFECNGIPLALHVYFALKKVLSSAYILSVDIIILLE